MRVVVIGAGPSGLACAACVKQQGAEVEILERASQIAPAWHGHYDRLHLHTHRNRSGLPMLPLPKAMGRYPSRQDFIAYLDQYAATFGLRPHFNCAVHTVRPDNGGWQVAHAHGIDQADVVIFATGLNGTPHRPELPGQASFPGPVLHSSSYRNADGFKGMAVLVVGFGNSGGDIALDLAEAGVDVTLSQRGPVNILPHDLFGIPITSMGGLRKILPYRLADALTAPILRAKIGRPESYGLQSAGKGPAAQVIEDGRVPLIDNGTLAAIRAGRIKMRPGITGINGASVGFADQTKADFAAIILATGYRTDLRKLLPDSHDALDDHGRPRLCGAPSPVKGLYFCSYKASADGQLRQTGIEAKAIAKHITNG